MFLFEKIYEEDGISLFDVLQMCKTHNVSFFTRYDRVADSFIIKLCRKEYQVNFTYSFDYLINAPSKALSYELRSRLLDMIEEIDRKEEENDQH